jgi:hypothetical protein
VNVEARVNHSTYVPIRPFDFVLRRHFFFCFLFVRHIYMCACICGGICECECFRTELETQLSALHSKLASSEEEFGKQVEEKRKLYAMYMEFRTKFTALVETKTKLQADLIKRHDFSL